MNKKTSKKAAGAKAPGPKTRAAAKTVTKTKSTPAATGGSLRVRMYRVGFGDFFLLIVPTAVGDRYILIDCGVFKGTTGRGDIGSIVEAVEDLYETTNGELALVIMTHRHADHIAGFSRAERFKDFKVSMVWMPYWEQFNDSKESSHNLQLDIAELAFQLAMQFRGRNDRQAQVALDQLWNATGIDFNAAPKDRKKLRGNAAALDLLKNHFGNGGKNVRYYAAGDKAELPPELNGLSVEILGPPPKDAKAFMALTDLKKGVGQYLDSTIPGNDGPEAVRPFPKYWNANPATEYPKRDAWGGAIDYKSLSAIVEKAQPDMLAAAAAKIDTFLNNQSLVTLFKFAGKNLLFVGDAQAGNWEHWLYKMDEPMKDLTKAGSFRDESSEILRTIDFYKVGHHGSTNATPIAVVDALNKDRSRKAFVAMCSTETDVYGNPEKGTEVPRDPLMKALGDECALIRSDSFEITTSEAVIAPAKGISGLPKLAAGKLRQGKLYVEYTF